MQDAFDEDRVENEKAKMIPKWLVQTLHGNKLNVPFFTRTSLVIQHGFYVSNC